MNSKKIAKSTGAVLVAATLLLAVLLAFAGFSVDLGLTYLQMRKIQLAADAGTLAGTKIFANPAYPQTSSAQYDTARDAAFAQAGIISGMNGVNLPNGSLRAGRWQGGVFVNGATPYNSLSIDLSSVVPTRFARILGVLSLTPVVHSVSVASPADESGCVRPFGISSDAFPTDPLPLNPLPYTFTNPQTFDVPANGQGNWGKIDLPNASGSAINMSSGPNFNYYMTHGVCGSTAVLNDSNPPDAGPGNSQFCSTLSALAQQGAPFYMFVTDDFPNGSHAVPLYRYAKGKINSCSGHGSNIVVNLTIYEISNTLPNGGNAVPGSNPKLTF